jgi:hypothetical protein
VRALALLPASRLVPELMPGIVQRCDRRATILIVCDEAAEVSERK